MKTFMGYRRPDGRAGIRNHVLILPASICASDTAEMAANRVKGAVCFHNQSGCSQVPVDQKLTMDVMAGYAANPNVYGTILLSIGCENCQMDLVSEEIRKRTNKPLRTFIIQECGGSLATVEQASRAAMELAIEASMIQKEPIPVSELILATECGGSDPTSGLASNPLVGELCDRLIRLGGAAILSETSELIGAEHLLAKRGKNEAVREQILSIVHEYEQYFTKFGENVRHGNPSPGNKAGGITTLEEKSLGCIHKGGHETVQAVYGYAGPVRDKGLVVMDTPGNDPSSVAGMVAGGAQLVVFTTGRGTPTGHPLAPVIKISGNRETCRSMRDHIDIDASPVIYGPQSMPELADDLLAYVLEVASGRITRAEALGFAETAVARLCNFT